MYYIKAASIIMLIDSPGTITRISNKLLDYKKLAKKAKAPKPKYNKTINTLL